MPYVCPGSTGSDGGNRSKRSERRMKTGYYVTSVFWSGLAKVFNAVVGFVSIPLLLKHFGMDQYGILSLATAANTYLQLMDLGMNMGSITFFSQWRAKGEHERIQRVAGTSISLYGLIGVLNALILIAIGLWGEGLFQVTAAEFVQLRLALFILAFFSVANWVTMVFSQLLISADRIAFTQQVQLVQTLLRLLLIVVTVYAGLGLHTYYFFTTLFFAGLFIPYYAKCRQLKLIHTLRPQWHWSEFQVVLLYSLSLFVLTFFQMSAANSRPILLGMFVSDAPRVIAEYRIIEVFPAFILSIGGMMTSIFLPKASGMTASGVQTDIDLFAVRATRMTSIMSVVLCVPVALLAEELIEVYVGPDYVHLAVWLRLWALSLLISLHTSPGNSLILASGKTRVLVVVTVIACLLSMLSNALLSPYMEVGSAVLSYAGYLLVMVVSDYLYIYPKSIGLPSKRMFWAFAKPALLGVTAFALIDYAWPSLLHVGDARFEIFVRGLLKGIAWLLLFVGGLFGLRIMSRSELLQLLGRA